MPLHRAILILLFMLLLHPLSAKKRPIIPDSLRTLTIEVNGVSILLNRMEGGSFVMGATNDQYDPDTSAGYIGFRVVLTLPNDPAMPYFSTGKSSDEDGYMPLTQKVRIKGRRLHFALVPGDEPYYISEEISASLWKKITGSEPPHKEHGVVLGMSLQERIRFAELCSRAANKPLAVATLAGRDTALSKSVILSPKQPKHKQSTRTTQRTRKTREKLSPWAELIGVKVKLPDDPVLLDFKGDANENLPLRLILRKLLIDEPKKPRNPVR